MHDNCSGDGNERVEQKFGRRSRFAFTFVHEASNSCSGCIAGCRFGVTAMSGAQVKARARLKCAGAALVFLSVVYCPALASDDGHSLRALMQSPDSPLPTYQKFLDVDDDADFPVRLRPRPEYNALGVRVGGMLFSPSLTVATFYDSNVYAVPTGRQADTGFLLSPELTAQSDFNNHELRLDFGIEHLGYAELTSESQTDAHAAASGRVDVSSDLVIAMAGSMARRHEQRGTSNSPATAAEPVPYDEFDGSVSVTKSFNRVEVSTGAAAEHRNYHDVPMVGGGTLDQDYRDGEIYIIGGRVAYKLKPGFRLYADARYNWRRYDNVAGANGDSQGYNLLAGAQFNVTSMVHGEIGIGYLGQFYDGAGIGDATGLSYLVDVIWTATPLMTVSIGGRRTVNESGLAAAPGRIDSTLQATIDYELRRNIIVSPSISVGHEDYVGIARTDWVVEPRLNLDYLVNRHFSVGAGYRYMTRDSNVNANDFDRHIVSVNAQAKL